MAHLWCTDVRVHQVIAIIIYADIIVMVIIVHLWSMRLRLMSAGRHQFCFALMIGQLFALEIIQ